MKDFNFPRKIGGMGRLYVKPGFLKKTVLMNM